MSRIYSASLWRTFKTITYVSPTNMLQYRIMHYSEIQRRTDRPKYDIYWSSSICCSLHIATSVSLYRVASLQSFIPVDLLHQARCCCRYVVDLLYSLSTGFLIMHLLMRDLLEQDINKFRTPKLVYVSVIIVIYALRSLLRKLILALTLSVT